MKALWILGAAAVMATASFASASSVSFDFRLNSFLPQYASSMHFDGSPSVTGLDVDVTAFSKSGNTVKSQYVSRWVGGLGVLQTGTLIGLPNQFDGLGSKEGLNFSFSSAVSLQSLTFSFADANDDVLIALTNGSQTTLFSGNVASGSVTINVANLGTNFMLTTLDRSDDYALSGLTVNYALSAQGPTAVPLPAAAMGGSALLGLVAARRRPRR